MKTLHNSARPSGLAMIQVFLLFAFLVLFPKGGIKAAGVPLTWGYAVLGLTAPILFLVRALLLPLRARVGAIGAVVLLLPIQLVFGYSVVVYGFVNLGYGVSMLTSVFVLPWLFLLVYPAFFQWVDPKRASKWFCACIFIAAVWGLVLFVYHHISGHYLEIPYLTVNAADAGQLDVSKHNARTGFNKLIATYNNGNLYGVATLILLPIYNQLETRRWHRGVLLVAMLLTLSRTVWVGLLIMEIVPLLLAVLQNVNTFPVLYLGKMTKRFIALGFMAVLVLIALGFATSSGLEFLLDPTLGGRRGEFPDLTRIPFITANPLIGFDESVYGSAAGFYGWFGLLSITLMLVSPVIVLLSDLSALKSPTRMAAFSGLMMYAVLAASDGAFVLIPVMAFYWFAYTVFVHGWPGAEAQPSDAAISRERPLTATYVLGSS